MRSQRGWRAPIIAICSSLSLREVLDHVARDAYPADRGCNRRSHSLSTKWVCKAKRALALFLLAFYHCSSRKVGGSATPTARIAFRGRFLFAKVSSRLWAGSQE